MTSIEVTRCSSLKLLSQNWVEFPYSANGDMPHPLIFRINSMRTKKIVYCGVLEFVAPDETIVLPNWVRASNPDFHGYAAYGGGAGQCVPRSLYSKCQLPEIETSSDCIHQPSRSKSLVDFSYQAWKLSSETSSVLLKVIPSQSRQTCPSTPSSSLTSSS